MKKQIIPAILEKNKKSFEKNFKIATQLSNVVQIDIIDGAFVENETPEDLNNGRWLNDFLIKNGQNNLELELHLMVLDPWSFIQEWREFDVVKRFIWHVEVPINHRDLIYQVHNLGFEAGLAVNPDSMILKTVDLLKNTLDSRLKKYAIDELLFLGVQTGFSGRRFNSEILEYIKVIKKFNKKIIIGVDGGIKENNIEEIAKFGVNRFNIGSAIFKSKDPKKSFQNLNNLIK